MSPLVPPSPAPASVYSLYQDQGMTSPVKISFDVVMADDVDAPADNITSPVSLGHRRNKSRGRWGDKVAFRDPPSPFSEVP